MIPYSTSTSAAGVTVYHRDRPIALVAKRERRPFGQSWFVLPPSGGEPEAHQTRHESPTGGVVAAIKQHQSEER